MSQGRDWNPWYLNTATPRIQRNRPDFRNLPRQTMSRPIPSDPVNYTSTSRGRPLPLGASPDRDGVNFAVMSRHATHVTLVLSPADANEPCTEIALDRFGNRTGNHWHIHVGGLPEQFRFGWRVDGPDGSLHRYDPNAILLDPTATTVAGSGRWGELCELPGPASSRRCLFRDLPHYDWRGDRPPLIAPEDSIIYELHLRGFTCDAASGVQHPGTFLGLAAKLPYLKELGVTALELLPIHEFDECDCRFTDPQTLQRNRNFWGYNSIAFAAPKASYAARGPRHEQVDEFRDFVRATHAAGIEVILDVVFNHTAEGDDTGRTYSFRGLDNSLYYLVDPDGAYRNFTGCGNTVNCNHPVVRHLIMNCLRYWVSRMHVDGFRFDLASVLGRDRQGRVHSEPPVVESIVEDGVLADCKLIAEPWDAAGLYQVGQFPFGLRWSEWNGKYRDDVRRFWRGDSNMVPTFMTRICGSADLYQPSCRKPFHSVNFITCHDGFTLWDLVSYDKKHNLANGEGNRDGLEENYSWNCGHEGETDDPAINALRQRQARNFIATLLLSQGVPMLLAGDEFLRTQQGNNNAWCQDNEISWIDWKLAQKNAGFLGFVQRLIAFRKRHPALRRREFLSGRGAAPDIRWHGIEPEEADLSASSHFIALTLDGTQTGRETDDDLYLAFNAGPDDLAIELPPSPNQRPWRRVLDTALPSPDDIVDECSALAAGDEYVVQERSVVVLIS